MGVSLHHLAETESESVLEIDRALEILLADVFALHLKTTVFHWLAFAVRDRDLLLDKHDPPTLAIGDPVAQCIPRVGCMMLHPMGEISRLQCIDCGSVEYAAPRDMLAELRNDNRKLVERMRRTQDLCARHGDAVTTGILEAWIDEAEGRTSMLSGVCRHTWST